MKLIELNLLSDLDVQSTKEYYKILVDNHKKKATDLTSKTFQVKKNENISLILKKINFKTPNVVLKKSKNLIAFIILK